MEFLANVSNPQTSVQGVGQCGNFQRYSRPKIAGCELMVARSPLSSICLRLWSSILSKNSQLDIESGHTVSGVIGISQMFTNLDLPSERTP